MAVSNGAEVKAYAILKGVKIWELAEYMGYAHENSLSRLLHSNFAEEKKIELKSAIDEIASKR